MWGGVQNKTYHAIRGGGRMYYRARPPNPPLQASDSGVGLVSALSSKEITGRHQTEVGEMYHMWGSKNLFGEPSYGMLPLSNFSIPLGHSLVKEEREKLSYLQALQFSPGQ